MPKVKRTAETGIFYLSRLRGKGEEFRVEGVSGGENKRGKGLKGMAELEYKKPSGL